MAPLATSPITAAFLKLESALWPGGNSAASSVCRRRKNVVPFRESASHVSFIVLQAKKKLDVLGIVAQLSKGMLSAFQQELAELTYLSSGAASRLCRRCGRVQNTWGRSFL